MRTTVSWVTVFFFFLTCSAIASDPCGVSFELSNCSICKAKDLFDGTSGKVKQDSPPAANWSRPQIDYFPCCERVGLHRSSFVPITPATADSIRSPPRTS
jgi:hypothetical protein